MEDRLTKLEARILAAEHVFGRAVAVLLAANGVTASQVRDLGAAVRNSAAKSIHAGEATAVSSHPSADQLSEAVGSLFRKLEMQLANPERS